MHIETVSDLMTALAGADEVALDLETTGLDPWRDRVALAAVATAHGSHSVDPALCPALFTLLADRLVIGHNLAFDLAFAREAGWPLPRQVWDTRLASILVAAGQHLHDRVPDPAGRVKRGRQVTVAYHSLAATAWRHLGRVVDKGLQVHFASGGGMTSEVMAYAAEDAAATFALWPVLEEALVRLGLEYPAWLEMALVPVLVQMHGRGVPFDRDAWNRLLQENQADLERLEARLAQQLPGINPRSPAQLKKVLAAAGIEVPDTREATLAMHAGHPLVADLLAYRERYKQVSTYGVSLLEKVNPRTGRLHPWFNQIGAETGRMSCTEPNLQQIPRDSRYRDCFREPGTRLVKADYSQIELRIAAAYAQDQVMLDAFARGEDVHALTARALAGHEPSKAERQLAKAVNFGLIYGMGAQKLQQYARQSYGVELSLEDAARFRATFFALYPGFARWHRSQPDGLVLVRTASGRARFVERFTDKVNTPVQGTGADMIKLALVKLAGALPAGATPVLAVHDEIVVETPEELVHEVAEVVQREMVAAARELLPGVAVEVEVTHGCAWSGSGC